jgi:hypothetical protein
MKASDMAKLQLVAGSENSIDTEGPAADRESTPNNVGASNRQQSDSGMHKKPYSKPTLTVYGTIRDLTKAVSNVGNADSATGGSRAKTGIGG